MKEINDLAEMLTVNPTGNASFLEHVMTDPQWNKRQVLRMVVEHLAQDSGVSPEQRGELRMFLAEYFPDSFLVKKVTGKPLSFELTR